MECAEFFSVISLLGAVVSTYPERSVAVVSYQGQTHHLKKGDDFYGVEIKSIKLRQTLQVKCDGEIKERRILNRIPSKIEDSEEISEDYSMYKYDYRGPSRPHDYEPEEELISDPED